MKSFKEILISGGWVTVIAITAVVYFLPFVPFRPTLLLVCGLANGRYLARWV